MNSHSTSSLPTGATAAADRKFSKARPLAARFGLHAKTIFRWADAGLIHQMCKQAPHKRFIPLAGTEGPCACNACPFMALNTLEKLYLALRDMMPRLELAEPLRQAALLPLERMLAMSASIPAPAETSAATVR